ncbi:MAG: DUF2332 family protein [Paracoccaceae bacterium]
MSEAAIRASFRDQARHCEAMGSALTGRVLRLLADRMARGAVAERVLGWTGDPSPRADALALRLAGGLHGLVLAGADPALAAAYAEPDASDARLGAALEAALAAHPGPLLRWLDSAPQTNEVRRSAVLIAAGHWLAARVGLPMVLSELGASAGLNLIWDHHALRAGGAWLGPQRAPVVLTPDWRGGPPPLCPPQVVAREGVDLNPLDPGRDRLRILSYVWADQADRLARTRAACDLAAGLPHRVARGDAVDWLEARLARRLDGRLHLVQHSIAWQYFPAAAQARGLALLAEAGARATADAPLAHLAMEADATPGSAAVTLSLWPGGERIALARAGFHGQFVDWLA